MKHALLWLTALALPASAQFTIDTVTLPEAVLGAPYPAAEIVTSNGQGPIQWSFILAPSPPAGFVIGPSAPGANVTTASFCYGVTDFATGRPICSGNVLGFAGSYLVNVRAQDANGSVATRVYTLQLVQALFIATPFLPDVVIGQPYGATLQGVGGTGSYSWMIASGSLPAGLVLNPTTGAITGTAPNSAGQTSFVVRMTDNGTGATALRTFAINVLGGLRITTSALPLAIAGEPLTPFQLTAIGGLNLTWSITPGFEIPPNFELSPSGVLSGDSSNPGVHRFSIRVRDDVSGLVDDRTFDLYVTTGVLRIVERDLPVAAVNFPYQAQLTPGGGLPPYQWSMGTLTSQGLAIEAQTGRITGTPPQLGTFQIPINLTDATGTRVTSLFTLQVVNTISIVTSSFPNGITGTPFQSTLIAAGGQAPYRWTLQSGFLPPGLTLDSVQGTIQGTPTQDGVFSFTLHVSDFGGRTATRQLAIVVGQGITIVTSALPAGVVGASYSAALQSSGGIAPLTWSIASGTLPAGLAFNAGTGVISGAATETATRSLTFRVIDGGGNSAERSLSLTIAPALSITTSAVSSGSRNAPYSFTLQTTGGSAPFTWSITSGALPPGLQIATASGVISGTPTTPGSYPFDVRVLDANGQVASAAFTLSISEPLTITTGALSGVTGTPLSVTLAASGGFAPYTFSLVAGRLPNGVAFNASSGVISGTPQQSGGFNLTFQVRDQAQQASTREIVLTVALPALSAVTIDGLDGITPGAQASASVRIAQPFPANISGTLFLQFVPAGAFVDDTVRFANGAREIPFTITAGSTDAIFTPGPNATMLTGTSAGAIILTTRFHAEGGEISPVPTPSKSVTIQPRAPVVSSVSLQRSGNTLTVVIVGYTTTHEISSGVFRFAAGAGSSLQQSEFTVSLSSAFTSWFGSATSGATGGQFRLTMPFSITGDAGVVTFTGGTLTNNAGSSTISGAP